MNVQNLRDCEGAILQRRYVIGSLIGRGSYGSVLNAHDLVTGKTVALKVGKENDESVRFECTQYRKIKGCKHIPDLVDVLKFEGNRYCLVLSKEGESLREYYTRTPSIPVPKIAFIMSEVLEGLRHLHRKQIIHRDLHLGNILLPLGENKAKLLLTDLGSSARIGEDGQFHGIIEPERMVPAFCTPLFVSLGHKFVETDDIFSLVYVALILIRSSATQTTREGFQLVKRNLYRDLDNTISGSSRVLYEFIKEVNNFRPADDDLREIPNYENLQNIIHRIPGFDETIVL